MPHYRLHIDAVPLAKKVHSAAFVARASRKKERSSGIFSKNPRAQRIWLFIWDKIQFVLVSAAVFTVIYLSLNWSAIQLNLEHSWKVSQGYTSPLERFTAGESPPPDLPQDASAQAAAPLPQGIPPLSLEIAPPDMRLIIPRINQNVPVIGVTNENLIARKWNELETDIQKALRNGVIHYPGTALPGDRGNVVITGHSSYYAWDPGRFKDVFALLHDVRIGDRIVIYFHQKKFLYEVSDIKTVLPKDVDVLAQTVGEQLTLITCTPIGTNLKRLVVTAKLIAK